MKISMFKTKSGRAFYSALTNDAVDVCRFLTQLEDILWERTSSGAFAFSDMIQCEACEAQRRMLAVAEVYLACQNCGLLQLDDDEAKIYCPSCKEFYP